MPRQVISFRANDFFETSFLFKQSLINCVLLKGGHGRNSCVKKFGFKNRVTIQTTIVASDVNLNAIFTYILLWKHQGALLQEKAMC